MAEVSTSTKFRERKLYHYRLEDKNSIPIFELILFDTEDRNVIFCSFDERDENDIFEYCGQIDPCKVLEIINKHSSILNSHKLEIQNPINDGKINRFEISNQKYKKEFCMYNLFENENSHSILISPETKELIEMHNEILDYLISCGLNKRIAKYK